jgi:hypothetical protein
MAFVTSVSPIPFITFTSTFHFLIYASSNNPEATSQLTLFSDSEQQIQSRADLLSNKVEKEEKRSDSSFPALDSSFVGIISISRLAQNVNYSHFLPLSSSPGNQVKVMIDYSAISQSIIGQPISAVMEVYSFDNRSLVRTSSLPDPVFANETGTIQLATTFTDNTLTNVIAIITLTDGSKVIPVSDSVHLMLRFGESSR